MFGELDKYLLIMVGAGTAILNEIVEKEKKPEIETAQHRSRFQKWGFKLKRLCRKDVGFDKYYINRVGCLSNIFRR
jgi:hypothetical protein